VTFTDFDLHDIHAVKHPVTGVHATGTISGSSLDATLSGWA